MKTTAICFLLITALVGGALGYSDSLRCRLIDWMDARSNHELVHERTGTYPEEYEYTGCRWWDLDMGDSVLVWLPGSQKLFFVDPYNTTEIDTIYSRTSFGSGWTSSTIMDSTLFMIAGMWYMASYIQADTINHIDSQILDWASFSYLAQEDSFIYTHNSEHFSHDTVGIICINVADPEDMFISCWFDDHSFPCGFEVLNGWVYRGDTGAWVSSDYRYAEDDTFGEFPLSTDEYEEVYFDAGRFYLRPDSTHGGDFFHVNHGFFGDLACDGKSWVYAVYSDLSPWPDWETEESHFVVLKTDTSFTFDQRWAGMAAFGVDVINDSLVAAGFEHGFSIVNVADFDDIHEVAYYMNEDTTMDFTNFALKGNRLYAMGHWEDDSTWARLWMFELDDSVVMGLVDAEPEIPERLRLHSYPNPFNSAVTIAVEGAGVCDTPLRVEIYDVAGRRVADIIPPSPPLTRGEGENPPLSKEDLVGLVWSPDESLSSGIYFARVKTDTYSVTTKLVYLS
ncbi:MAG: hypothetical protein ACP5G4_08810 [bacterium]